MKRFIVSAVILFLAASHFPVAAQEVDEATAIRRKAMAKIMPRSFGMTIQLMGNGMTLNSNFIENGDEKDFQQYTGVTDEQYREFSDFMLGTREVVREQMRPLMVQIAEENDPDKLTELVDAWQTATLQLIADAEAKAAEILTPAQIAKFREFDLHMNQQMQQAGLPFFNFESYAALDLTSEQQKRLHEIRDGFRKEQMAQMEEFSKLLPKPGEKPDPKKMQEMMEKQHELGEKGKKLYTRMKAKVLAILTKEQTATLEKILQKTPDCMTSMLKRRTLPPPQIDEKKYDAWKESWKPGDPIPEEYRRHEKARRRAFPR